MYSWSLPPRDVLKIVNFKRQFEFLLNQLLELWSIARNVPSLMSKFYRKRELYPCSRNTNKLFQSAFVNLRSWKHFRLGLPGWILRTWVGLINRYNNFFVMLGFIPFLSWWGILANIEQRKKGSDVMFGSIFFNLDSASFRFACFHR